MANQPGHRLRIMVDTNVLISGLVWPRWSYEILQYVRKQEIELILCPFIIDEVYRNIKKYFPQSSPNLTESLASCRYQEIADPTTEELQQNVTLMRDPYDIPIALAAISAQVNYFITQDRDFTDHGSDTEQLHQRLNILLPGTFLREQMGWTSEHLEAVRGRNWQDLL